LRYVWGRIEVQEQFVAATHAGQFLDRPPGGEAWSLSIKDLSIVTGVGAEVLQQAVPSIPILDRQRRQQVVHLLHRLAATFSEIGVERLNLLGRLQRIAEISNV
jgi:hypothetical protein